MHPSHLKKAIGRTRKQLRKQRNKLHYSEELNDKVAAKSEIKRLLEKLSGLQCVSNGS